MAVLRSGRKGNDMDSIVIKTYPVKEVKSEIVRLRPDAQRIVQQMQRESGLSASHLVSEIIKQASPYVVFEEAIDDEP